MHMYMHICIIYMYIYIHIYMYTYIYLFIYAHTSAHVNTHARAHAHAHIYAHIGCACVQIYTNAHRACMHDLCTCMHTHMRTCMHACMFTHMRTCMHICMHTHTHTHTYTCMHTAMHASAHGHGWWGRGDDILGDGSLFSVPAWVAYVLLQCRVQGSRAHNAHSTCTHTCAHTEYMQYARACAQQ